MKSIYLLCNFKATGSIPFVFLLNRISIFHSNLLKFLFYHSQQIFNPQDFLFLPLVILIPNFK